MVFSFEPDWHAFEIRRFIQKTIIKEKMLEAVEQRISEIEEEARRDMEDFQAWAEEFTEENAPLRVEISAFAPDARTIDRYCHEHPDGVRLKELYRKHFFTLVDTAQQDQRLAKELAALGVSID